MNGVKVYIGEVILLGFIYFTFEALYVQNVEGIAKLVCLIALMIFSGLLFSLLFTQIIKYFTK